VIAGTLAASGKEEANDPRAAALLRQGWSAADEAPCDGLTGGRFYDVAGGEESAELYVPETGPILSPRLSWPPAPRSCREIPGPSDIEEVQ
jgi:hypothetical protein